MTVVKDRICHAYFRGGDAEGRCNTDCQWWVDGWPCEMWIPEKYWDKSICESCTHQGEKCHHKYVKDKFSDKMIACDGWEEK